MSFMSDLIFTLANRGIIWDSIRGFLSWIDSIFFMAITWFFQTIFVLANFELNSLYEDLLQRVYVILGIFMLFKLLVSFLGYLVNPDKINDKEQGAGKVVMRVILVFIMLLGLPVLFEVMTELQNRLIVTVPRIVIGENAGGDFFDDDTGDADISGIADAMTLSIYRGFVTVNKSDTCGANVNAIPNWQNVTDVANSINEPCPNDSKEYLYNYIPIIPIIVAVVMLYVIVCLNIDVAIRAFKLLILRTLSPVAVISYIDPKSSKDGIFSKWVKTFFSVWGSLFLNLALIYFVIYLIGRIFSGDFWGEFFAGVSSSDPFSTILVIIIIIIALLFFARQAPKFIMDALGIKNNGSFTKMLGMGSAALGGIGAARAAYRARNEYDQENHLGSHRIRNAAKSLFSGLGAVSAGGNAILSTDKPSLMTGYDAQAKNNATMLSRIASGSSVGGRLGAMYDMLLSGETEADRNERKIKAMEDFNKALGAIGSRAKDEMVKQDWTQSIVGKLKADGTWDYFMKDTSGSVVTGAINYKDFMARKNAAASSGLGEFEIQTSNGIRKISMADAERYQGLLLKGNESNYIERTIKGGDHEDAVMVSLEQDANEKSTITGFKVTDRDSVKQTQDQLSIDTTQLHRENVKHVANRRGQGNKGN